MQMTKIAGARRRLYAVGDGRLWLRGYHDNWEAIETPDDYGRHIAIADVTAGSNEAEDEIFIYILTQDGRIFERRDSVPGWSEIQ